MYSVNKSVWTFQSNFLNEPHTISYDLQSFFGIVEDLVYTSLCYCFEVTKQVLFRFFFLPTVRQSKTLKDHNDDNDGLNNHNKLPQKRCSTAFLSFITELTEFFLIQL